METISQRLTIVVLATSLSVVLSACGTSVAPTGGAPAVRAPGPITTGQLPRAGFFEGATLKSSDIDSTVQNVRAGGVLIVSEEHGNQKHYANQKLALNALNKTGACTVSVGLEFLHWTQQTAITDYFSRKLSEADFLKAVEWGGNPFSDYRDQALFAQSTGGVLIGINAPKRLTSSISKSGLANLSPELLQLMPPNFELGRADYRERFDRVMVGHVPATAFDKYFASHSVWDDSMAWISAEFLKSNPTHCLVVIVGDFHAAWGGGLPDRMAARGISNVTVISQIETSNLTEVDLTAELGPHPRYGARADAIWLSQSPAVAP